MRKIEAYEAFAIHADYDGNAPDTCALVLFESRKLADEVCAELNKDPRAWGRLAFVDGFEHCKTFRVTEHLVRDPQGMHVFDDEQHGVEDVLAVLAEDGD